MTKDDLIAKGFVKNANGNFVKAKRVSVAIPTGAASSPGLAPSPSHSSNLETRFELLWKSCDGPELIREHRFDPIRRWRFDFAHLASKVAIEIEGGVWMGKGHTSGQGFIDDCEKYNEATLAGWKVIRLTANMINEPNIERINSILKAN